MVASVLPLARLNRTDPCASSARRRLPKHVLNFKTRGRLPFISQAVAFRLPPQSGGVAAASLVGSFISIISRRLSIGAAIDGVLQP